MAGKRERRVFGAVRRLPSGRWQVRYRDLHGNPHTGPHTFASKADAARYLALVEADLTRGAWADPKLGRITFAEWAERWQATTTTLRPTTRDLYAYLLRRFQLPRFGPVALASIDVMAVRAWLARLRADSLSASTAAKRTGCCRASPAARSRRATCPVVPARSRVLGWSVPRRCGSPPSPRSRRWPTRCPAATGRWCWWPPTAGFVGQSWSACGSGGWICCTAGSPWPSRSPR